MECGLGYGGVRRQRLCVQELPLPQSGSATWAGKRGYRLRFRHRCSAHGYACRADRAIAAQDVSAAKAAKAKPERSAGCLRSVECGQRKGNVLLLILDRGRPGCVNRLVVVERSDIRERIPTVGERFAVRVIDGSVQRHHIVAGHDGGIGDDRYLNCHILTYAKSTRPNVEAG